MKSVLVVYYTRSGYTRRVAEQLARLLDADLEEIVEKRGRAGMLGFVRSIVDVSRGRRPRILAARHDPAAYRAVVIGSPVWAAHVCSPVRSYIVRHAAALRRVALFCTQGAYGGAEALAEMAALRDRELDAVEPIAAPTLALTDREIDAGAADRLAHFADEVRRLAG